MPRKKTSLSLFLILSTFSFTQSFADDFQTLPVIENQETEIQLQSLFGEASQITSIEPAPTPICTPEPPVAPKLEVVKVIETPVSPFTGKVKGKKVRMRVQADLDSQIVKELNKTDYLTIVGEKGNFWAVEAPAETKAYVFRRFVIDNEVEGNKVNVRLEPTLESPIIGHLNAGEKVQGAISALNNKWLEIAPPANTRFYVAKEYITNVGGPEFKATIEKRKTDVENLFTEVSTLSKAELEKAFDEMDMEKVNASFAALIENYNDFPEYAEKAKEALTLAQESYLQKKLAYLELQKEAAIVEKEDLIAATHSAAAEKARAIMHSITDKMKLWEPIEEALYLSWANFHDDRSMQDYYEDQKVSPVVITGILEAYASPVKNKPGDFIVKDKDIPVGYVYSTTVNLQNFVGKKITAIAAQRPNNNFAFPAYYVLGVE